MVRLAGSLISTMFEMASIVLHFTSVPLLMVELDGMIRRDEILVAPLGAVTYVIPICACFEPYPVPFNIHTATTIAVEHCWSIILKYCAILYKDYGLSST